MFDEENEKMMEDGAEMKKEEAYNPYLGKVNSGEDEDEDGSSLPAEKAWYVINTFNTKEAKVAEDLELRRKSFHMEDKIFRIVVAKYDEPVLDENGNPKTVKDKLAGQMKPKVKTKNFYPGYIFVEMIMTDETWFVVRNTPGVSGITGSSGKGAKPFPIPREEIEPVLKRMNINDPDIYSDYKIGDEVKLISGMFRDSEGVIESIDTERGEVTVQIMLFGRSNDIPAKFSDIEKVQEVPNYNEGSKL